MITRFKNLSIFGCVTTVAILMAVSVTSLKIDSKTAKAVNDVVLKKQSTSCVILFINKKILFVGTEEDAPMQLSRFRDLIRKTHLDIIKSSFRPKKPKDILNTLPKIANAYKNFLVYFSVENVKPAKSKEGETIVSETTKPVGIIGHAMAALGISVADKGIVPIIFSILGINTSEKVVKIIQF